MKNIILISALILMFLLTELTLRYFLPLSETDWDVWMEYFRIKDAVYDIMFFISFYLVFEVTSDKIKAFACFGVIVSGGSVIDKVIFGINKYLVSDIVLILMALAISIYFYKKRWKISKPG